MPYEDRMADYITVAERIAEFYAKYPDGSLQPLDPSRPYTTTTFGEDQNRRMFIVYVAAAYRTPSDSRPGIGVAWEPYPGRTPYTRDSEAQNAETSAWGRAIAALGIATKRGVATAEDVRNRELHEPVRQARPVQQQPAQRAEHAGDGTVPASAAHGLGEPVPELDEKQILARDFAINANAIVAEGGSVDDLKTVVYEPAKTARCLRTMVPNPFEEGAPKTQLSAVITHAKNLIEAAGGQA